MNLFFIHTPFQLLVAQNLIFKEKLNNNIALFGNTGKGAQHFYQIFDVMFIKETWKGNITLGDLNHGIYSFKSPFCSYLNLIKFSKNVS